MTSTRRWSPAIPVLACFWKVSHDRFLQMLSLAWHKEATPSHIAAVLKRTHIIINTESFWYFREAGEEAKPVPRLRLGHKTDYLRLAFRSKYDRWRNGSREMPSDFTTVLSWERDRLDAVQRGQRAPDTPWPTIGGDRTSQADGTLAIMAPRGMLPGDGADGWGERRRRPIGVGRRAGCGEA